MSDHDETLTEHGYELTHKGGDYHSYTHPKTGHEIHVDKHTGSWIQEGQQGAFNRPNTLKAHLKVHASQHAEEVLDEPETELVEAGHVTPERAEEIVKGNPAFFRGPK